MSYKANPKEIETVSRLPAPKRYSYFLGKVVDWQEVWGIKNDSGWTLVADDSGRQLVPLWPAAAFAAQCCIGEWSDCVPASISLDDLFEKWIPGMQRDQRNVAVFPMPDGKAVNVEPLRLGGDLQQELKQFED